MNNMLTLKPLTAGHDGGKERSFSERQTGLWPCPAGISSMLPQHTWPISWACTLCPLPCSVPPVEWRAAIPQRLTLLPHCLSGSPVWSWILLWLFCFMVSKITDDSLVHLQVWDLVPFYPWRQEPQRKYFGKIIWAHAPSLSFIPMAPEGRYFMAHLIKQLPLLSSKNIHIKPVIRAWNPEGVTIYTTKENKVTSKTSQLCGMNGKKSR